MVAKQGTALRPLRIARAGNRSIPGSSLPPVPDRVPRHLVAPDWVGPTEGNGSDTPRADLHVALLAPDHTTANLWRPRARVVTPPLWAGKVHLHVVVMDVIHGDPEVLLAMVDLGLIDSVDAGLVGYPSGLDS